jgi:hypothetical protein
LFAIDPGRGGIQGYILFDDAELQGIVQGIGIGGIGAAARAQRTGKMIGDNNR